MLMLEHHALLFFLTRAGHRQRGVGGVCVVGGKGCAHMNAQTHTLAESQGFFQHRLCMSLAVCHSNQSESDCGTVGFYRQFPALSHAHMNTSRIIESKREFYNLLLKLYSLSISVTFCYCFMDF